jgi:serine/threonine-protein kinase
MEQPERLGDYALTERLARGDTTEVWEARWEGPPGDGPERVCVKVVRAERRADKGESKLLLREATLARRLDHPNIGRTIALGDEDGVGFQVMELVDGPSLAALLASARARGQRPTPAQALQLVRPLCEALVYAHGLADHVFHLRVNPRNVLIEPPDGLKLIDFSVPRGVDATMPGTSLGPPEDVGYLAPEQILGLAVDGHADQFAVAAILWEAMIGEPLFADAREAEQARVPRASERRMGLPASVDALLERALQRAPDDRFDDMSEMLGALDEALAELEPSEAKRAAAPWIAKVLSRPEDEATRPDTNQATASSQTVEATIPGTGDRTLDPPVDATEEALPTASTDDATASQARAEPAPPAEEHTDKVKPDELFDELGQTLVEETVDSSDTMRMPVSPAMETRTTPGTASKPAVTHIITQSPAEPSRAGPSIAVVAGVALVAGLVVGGVVVFLARSSPAPAPAVAAAIPIVPDDAALSGQEPVSDDEDDGPAGCGRPPIGEAYERSRVVVADARAALDRRDFVEAKRLLRGTLRNASTSAAHYELGRIAAIEGDVEAARKAFGCALVLAPESQDAQRAGEELAKLSGVSVPVDKRGRGRGRKAARKTATIDREVALKQLRSCKSPCARLLVDALRRRSTDHVDENLAFATERCLDQCRDTASAKVAKELSRTAARAALRGDLKGAERAARKGLELNPDDPALHRLLGTVYRKQGKKTRARRHFSRYLELAPAAKDAATVRKYLKGGK